MKKLVHAALLVSLCALITHPVLACRYEPDQRDLVTRLQDEEIAFIGRLAKVNADHATFDVLVPLRGIESKTFETSSHGTTCHWDFLNQKIGSLWLYAGDTFLYPTIEIKEIVDAPSK